MHIDEDTGFRDLEAQLASKEREWKELQAERVHQLETFLRKTQEECSTLRKQYKQLKEDFQFNLALLDERDRELEKYDAVTARALTVEQNRHAELNRLRQQITELEEQRAREEEERQEELSTHQHTAAQLRLQLDELQRTMSGENKSQMEKYEQMKMDLQRRIKSVEAEQSQQRQEMTAAFDGELRQREHEFNLKMDEMRAIVLAHDMKVKLLSKEAEVHCQAQLQATEALKASSEFCQQMQTQLQLKNQEVKEAIAVKDYRIKELEDELKQMGVKLKEEKDEDRKKYEDVVRTLKKRDAQLQAQRQAHTEQLQKADKHIVKLQEKMEAVTAQARCTQEAQQEALKQKDESIQRLHTEVEATRAEWDKYIRQVSSETVAKDTEMITLQEREAKLRAELERSRDQTERYKQDLSAGLMRERALEQKGVQVELEWQRRCEDLKAELYLADEQLIQELTQARDQAKAELKEKEQELQNLTVLLRSVKTERDQALQGLTPRGDSLASEEICRLQEQNSVLRAVVTQMRKDMEDFTHQLHRQHEAQPAQHPGSTSIKPSVQTQTDTGPATRSKDSQADHTRPQEQEMSPSTKPLGGAAGQSNLAASTVQPTEDLQVPDSSQLHNQGLRQGGERVSAVVKQVRETQMESALASIIQQSALVHRLREENLYLQARASGLDNVRHAKDNPPLLHTRLKRAAACIAHLSRDKQQLIEMVNRLRAQAAAAGPQEPEEPERDTSTERQTDQQQGRLSVLEQLQYQLTTQELQYALKQRTYTAAEQLHPRTNNHDPVTKQPANAHQEHTGAPERPQSKENTSPLSHSGLSRLRLSSEESLRSLQELWEILDHGRSSSIFSEGEGELSRKELARPGGSGVQMMVQGSGLTQSQPPTEVQPKRNVSKTPSKTKIHKPGASGKFSNIRNYNIKE
ncbi:coiled-coil domain-containing protein 57 [Parambassis ranga]|uniref:Coiled-coil domain-containing protein 57 n=1 Tax=Parambassis ranga TaxID=210632 RepID=A0A6P7IGB8_9TELE|nr:coiled-coil domain-containing protein 57 [Parambassis ranga]